MKDIGLTDEQIADNVRNALAEYRHTLEDIKAHPETCLDENEKPSRREYQKTLGLMETIIVALEMILEE